jgi:serine/threonine-protein kinase RsbT
MMKSFAIESLSFGACGGSAVALDLEDGLEFPAKRGSRRDMVSQHHVQITSDTDVVTARQLGREFAAEEGFSGGDQTVIAAAISEIARNILNYAQTGEVTLHSAHEAERRGIVVVARDDGPGIPDVALALQDGYTTSGGLGLGLPGSRRLMDEFSVVSSLGTGTLVTMKKWRRRGATK